MKEVNRRDLEPELFIFQREDVTNKDRWYCSYKLNGVKRIYKALGVMSEQNAAKLARRELSRAEETLEQHGASAVVGGNRIGDATRWFKKNGDDLVSADRYRLIVAHWDNHFSQFFGPKTVVDKRLQKRMSKYVEYRRRVINKSTGKRLHAAASTIKLELVSAKQLLTMAHEHAGIGQSVGRLSIQINKSKLVQGKSRSTTFTDNEVEKIKRFFDDDAETLRCESAGDSHARRTAQRRLYLLERLRFFVALSFATGARVNELRQVRHADFSEDFQTLRIRRSKTRSGSNRQAYIDNEIWDIREAYARYMDLCKTKKANSLIFAELEGRVSEQEPKVLANAGQTFGKFLKSHRMLYEKVHGKRRRNFFATRHYWITRQVNDEQPAFGVAQSAGTSVKMIEATYYESDASTTAKNFERQKAKTRRTPLRRVK